MSFKALIKWCNRGVVSHAKRKFLIYHRYYFAFSKILPWQMKRIFFIVFIFLRKLISFDILHYLVFCFRVLSLSILSSQNDSESYAFSIPYQGSFGTFYCIANQEIPATSEQHLCDIQFSAAAVALKSRIAICSKISPSSSFLPYCSSVPSISLQISLIDIFHPHLPGWFLAIPRHPEHGRSYFFKNAG